MISSEELAETWKKEAKDLKRSICEALGVEDMPIVDIVNKVASQEAQINGLVGALEAGTTAIDALRIYTSSDVEALLYQIMAQFDQTLSTLPPQWLEQRRKEQAFITAGSKQFEEAKEHGLVPLSKEFWQAAEAIRGESK